MNNEIKEILENENVIYFISDLINEKNDYKLRIEKAVEYIEKNDYHYMNEYALKRFRNDLLNILNGRK